MFSRDKDTQIWAGECREIREERDKDDVSDDGLYPGNGKGDIIAVSCV
jgi:hypothetical protein